MPDKVNVVAVWWGGGGVEQGQTKRQIVGSLDMSRSLHQTKKLRPNVLRSRAGGSEVGLLITGLAFPSPFHSNTGEFGVYCGGCGGGVLN